MRYYPFTRLWNGIFPLPHLSLNFYYGGPARVNSNKRHGPKSSDSAQIKEMTTVVWTSLLYCDFLRASKLIKGQLKSRKYAKYLRFAAQLVYRVPYTNRQRPWEVLGTRLSITYARHRSYLRSLELVLSFLCRSVICCANLCHLLICDILWSWEESIRRRTRMTKNTRVNQGPR